jgi:hypothetical protein
VAKGAREPGTNRGATPLHAKSASETPADLGISYVQSHRWQKLVEIPDAEFERTFAGTGKPSTTGIITAHEPAKPAGPVVDDRALWLCGQLKDFERLGVLEAEPQALADTMLRHMKEAVRELVPVVGRWLERLMRCDGIIHLTRRVRSIR